MLVISSVRFLDKNNHGSKIGEDDGTKTKEKQERKKTIVVILRSFSPYLKQNKATNFLGVTSHTKE